MRTDEQRLDDLLLEWDERRRRGEEVSVAELVEDCPALVDRLRRGAEALRATDWLENPWDVEPETFRRSSSAGGEVDPPLCGRAFRRALTDAELIAPDQIDELLRQVDGAGDEEPQSLADALVAAGVLTRFQAEALLEGRGAELVIDKYLILESLGAGGMGVVFKALHRPMNRLVALKMITPQFVDSPEKQRRFRREVRVAASLSHPNIVTAYDADESKGVHFLVMEYVPGRDLEAHVRENGPLSVSSAVDCAVQAARGLQHAHDRGVVHRDVKPRNLMLASDGAVKVLDLGVARLEASLVATTAHEEPVPGSSSAEEHPVRLTTDGSLVGTIAYMAPEQANAGDAVDQRADVYGLGCTLYFLLVGEPPYEAENAVALVMAHREAQPPSIRKVRPDVPEELERLFLRMVAKRPEDRPQSMAEVVAVLEALDGVRGRGDGPSGQHGSTAKSPKSPRRYWWLWGGIAMAVSAAAVFGVWNGALRESRRDLDANEATARAVETGTRTSTTGAVDEEMNPRLTVCSNHFGDWSLITLNADGSGIRKVRPGELFGPAYSPDGTKIAYWAGPLWREQIFVMNTDGTESRQLTDHEFRCDSPSWSPAGDKIAFSMAFLTRRPQWAGVFQDNRDIYVMNADGSGVVQLTDDPSWDYCPSWSPDGSKIAFVSHRTGMGIASLVVMNADGSGQENLLQRPVAWVSHPTWSLDGRRIAFTGMAEERKKQLFVVDVSTKGFRQLTTEGANAHPAWSPDGRYIGYVRYNAKEDDIGDLMVLDVARDTHTVLLEDTVGRNEKARLGWVVPRDTQTPRTHSETTRAATPPNYALEFDGEDHVVRTPLKLPESGVYTLEAWATPTAPFSEGTHHVVVGSWEGHLKITPGGRWEFLTVSAETKGNWQFVNSRVAAEAGLRQHVAAVATPDEIRIFVDGKLAGTRILTEELQTGLASIVVGGPTVEGMSGFPGVVDEVRISDVARYAEDFVPAPRFDPDEHTLALYHFDEGKGDLVRDASGNEHLGQIRGAKWVRADSDDGGRTWSPVEPIEDLRHPKSR